MSEISRRGFLYAGAGGLSASTMASSAIAALPNANYKVEDQLPFKGQTRRLKLTNNDRCIASLIFATDYPTHFRLKPEFYPVCTPEGIPVTDSHQYCFIHHQSIMTGHGKVRLDGADRDVDFYRQLPYRDESRKDTFHAGHKNLFHLGPSGIQKITSAQWDVSDHITLRLTLEWQSREHNSEGGQPLIIERRRYDVVQRGPLTIIDQFSRLVPTIKPFTLMADRHSFVGIRVHDLIDPDEGGVMRDSEGRINPDGDYWDKQGERKAPKWIDCSGKIGNKSVGIALFSHPNNVRNEFYCRGWGLMICSATLGHDVRVSHKEPFDFSARFVAHDGELTRATADDLYQQFADLERKDEPPD
jgi:hypothetical protein